MNRDCFFHLKIRHLVILAGILAVSLSLTYFFSFTEVRKTEDYINKSEIESVLEEKYSGLKAETEKLAEKFENGDKNPEEYFYTESSGLFEKNETGFFFYKENNLKYWSTNNIPVPVSTTFGFFDKPIANLNNGWYICYAIQKEDWHIVGLYQLKKEYSYENDIIKNSFSKSLNIDESIVVSTDSVPGSVKICFNDKKSCFYLLFEEDNMQVEPHFTFRNFLIIFNFMIFSFILIIAILMLADKYKIINKTFPLLLFICLFVFRYLLLKAGYTSSMSELRFWGPELFAESFWMPSLGEYAINVYLFFMFSVVFVFYYKPELNCKTNRFITSVFSLSVSILMYMCGVFISGLFFGLVWNSSISFSFENVLNLDIFSFLGIIIIVGVVLGFVLIFYRLLHILKKYLSTLQISVFLLLLHAGSLFFYRPEEISFDTGLIFGTLFYLLWVTLTYISLRRKVTYFLSVILLILISLITSEHFSRLSNKKEIDAYKVITYNLAAERDVSAEFFLKETYNEIKSDQKLSELISAKDFKGIENSINNILLSKRYFNKYEIQTTICLCSDSLLIEPDMISVDCFEFFRNQIDSYGIIIPNTNFYFLDNHNGRISYLGEIGTKLKDSVFINIYIELNSKIFSEGLGYPEMLLDKKLLVKKTAKEYNYAKYNKGRLISSKGDFKYQFTLKPEENDTAEYSYYVNDGYIHFKYRPDKENIIILSKPDTQYSKETVSFTYILSFLFIIFNLLWLLVNFKNGNLKNGATLKVKIQISFITILILSLILTGSISIYFIVQGYKQKQKETVQDKAHSVLVELEHKVGNAKKLNYEDAKELNSILVKFSNVFYTDINIYDLNGILLSSSRIELYDKGLKGRYLDSEAYRELILNNSGTVIVNETIDNISYLSAYVPFRNYDNEIIAYLNLPYFARQSEFTEEISNFVIAFSNIFLALILMAVVIGIFISRQLTRPLVIIQEKIKAMDIKKKAEKIIYTRNDELGGLIREYNRKVDELSESANKLAQSEREMAWREMAKQIAHEIKNPLTPMKLSVQYLERAYDLKDENWEKTYRKVNKTLIEQIDILSGIASEFSNFAKMPASKKEIINLKDLITTSVQLFETTENVEFTVITDIKNTGEINADKEQMLRVFNNLIKNGIQAIPDGKHGEIKISMEELDKSYIVKVADNGCGIPEAMRPKIFQPNFTTKSAGMGLGLSMVKSMLISNNATIYFNTEEGKGTEFVIEIPMEN